MQQMEHPAGTSVFLKKEYLNSVFRLAGRYAKKKMGIFANDAVCTQQIGMGET